MSNLNTDAEGSPPPPPAPADPSVEAANAAVAAAAAAAAAADGTQYSDMYPTYNSYLMTRYSDQHQRYHSPSLYTTTPSYSSHISAHTSTDSGYYRYPDYSRYPYSGGNPTGPTSPRWRRRSYDPDYLSRRSAAAASSSSRPLTDLAASLSNNSPSSSVLMRSRSRSRVPQEYDPNAYLRYVSPSTSSYSTRPTSGYIYGHSYIPSTTSLHNMDYQTRLGSPSASATIVTTAGNGGQQQQAPQPPPNYNAMDREVSARIRRYQADPSS